MPFGDYKDFDDCMSKNSDKNSPEAYCAVIHKKITGKWPAEKERIRQKLIMREKISIMEEMFKS